MTVGGRRGGVEDDVCGTINEGPGRCAAHNGTTRRNGGKRHNGECVWWCTGRRRRRLLLPRGRHASREDDAERKRRSPKQLKPATHLVQSRPCCVPHKVHMNEQQRPLVGNEQEHRLAHQNIVNTQLFDAGVAEHFTRSQDRCPYSVSLVQRKHGEPQLAAQQRRPRVRQHHVCGHDDKLGGAPCSFDQGAQGTRDRGSVILVGRPTETSAWAHTQCEFGGWVVWKRMLLHPR
jgi:hypothetical protein